MTSQHLKDHIEAYIRGGHVVHHDPKIHKGMGTYFLMYATCLGLAIGNFFRKLQVYDLSWALWYGVATFLLLVYGLGIMVKLRDEGEL